MKVIFQIVALFLIWRIVLFGVAFWAEFLLPSFGNSFPYFDKLLIPTGLPGWVWGFGNFDGVHYLRIVLFGYSSQLSQAFFPLYPLLIKFISGGENVFLVALILSNFLAILALILFFKLIRIDFDKRIALLTIIFTLCFPTAFFLGAIYSESLFLVLILGTLLLIRRRKFLMAGIIAAFASATRIFGILIIPVLIIEIYNLVKSGQIKLKSLFFIRSALGVLISGGGLLAYMFFLQVQFQNPIYFFTAQPSFGAQRSGDSIILLPQVLFRYLKILTNVPFFSPPFITASLEVLFTLIPLTLLIIFFKKIRLSYAIFILSCLILPTLTGTLSSMPRYALMSFLIFPLIVSRFKRFIPAIMILLFLLQTYMVILFVRGYWVA